MISLHETSLSSARRLQEEKWSACALLSAMESQGVRKFIVTSTHAEEVPLFVWIFASDLDITSTNENRNIMMRAVKVMWKITSLEEADRLDSALSSQSLSLGTLELMEQDFTQFKTALKQSADLLPSASRKLQDWNVALLPQFTLADVS